MEPLNAPKVLEACDIPKRPRCLIGGSEEKHKLQCSGEVLPEQPRMTLTKKDFEQIMKWKDEINKVWWGL